MTYILNRLKYLANWSLSSVTLAKLGSRVNPPWLCSFRV